MTQKDIEANPDDMCCSCEVDSLCERSSLSACRGLEKNFAKFSKILVLQAPPKK